MNKKLVKKGAFRLILILICVLAIFVGWMILSSLLIQWLWNTLANYFGFKTINFFIALVINIVFTLIVTAFKPSKK